MTNREPSSSIDLVLDYSLGVKLVSAIGVPALSGVALWMIHSGLTGDDGLLASGFRVLLGSAVAYQCAIGWLTLLWLNVRVTLERDGVTIRRGASERRVGWEELASAREFTFATAVQFLDRNGRTLFWAWDNMRNLHELKAALAEQV